MDCKRLLSPSVPTVYPTSADQLIGRTPLV